LDHWHLISLCIRERIDVDDAVHATSKTPQEEDFESEEEENINPYENGKMKIGAKQPPDTIDNIETQLKDVDIAFKDFRKKLTSFLNQFCVAHNIPRPGNKYFTVDKHTIVSLICAIINENFIVTMQVTEFRYLHIRYESCVTWCVETDMLHCNPSFNHAPRYDCVMVQMSSESGSFIFARLIFIFTFMLADTSYPFALVHPLDAPTGILRRKERDLGLIRLRAKHRREAEFIPLSSIIRGAYIVPEFDQTGEYYHVVDTVDTDMFLRLRRVERYRFLNHPMQ